MFVGLCACASLCLSVYVYVLVYIQLSWRTSCQIPNHVHDFLKSFYEPHRIRINKKALLLVYKTSRTPKIMTRKWHQHNLLWYPEFIKLMCMTNYIGNLKQYFRKLKINVRVFRKLYIILGLMVINSVLIHV